MRCIYIEYVPRGTQLDAHFLLKKSMPVRRDLFFLFCSTWNTFTCVVRILKKYTYYFFHVEHFKFTAFEMYNIFFHVEQILLRLIIVNTLFPRYKLLI